MCRSRMLSAIGLSVLLCHPAVSYADAELLRTIQLLDEDRGYCLDIRGEGPTVQLDAALQVHTCKYGSTIDDQRFEHTTDGAIRASVYNRCVAADDAREGNQSFRWSPPTERGLSSAEIARNGMPPELAAQLIALRSAPDAIPQTYAQQRHVFDASEIKVVSNIAYGPHERQQIDIHTGTMRRARGPVPVIAVFHELVPAAIPRMAGAIIHPVK